MSRPGSQGTAQHQRVNLCAHNPRHTLLPGSLPPSSGYRLPLSAASFPPTPLQELTSTGHPTTGQNSAVPSPPETRIPRIRTGLEGWIATRGHSCSQACWVCWRKGKNQTWHPANSRCPFSRALGAPQPPCGSFPLGTLAHSESLLPHALCSLVTHFSSQYLVEELICTEHNPGTVAGVKY